MLKELYLDGNPIDSMPNCVRTLPKLKILSMKYCDKLKSVEKPPHTLTMLWLRLYYDENVIEKVVFDPEMSPLKLSSTHRFDRPGSYEIEGMVKIQPMLDVEEKVLRSLGWTNLYFLNKRHLRTNSWGNEIQVLCG